MNKFFGIPYFVWLTASILIAAAYFIYVPKIANSPNISFIQRFIIKYAHAMVWVLLAIACIAANYKRNDVAKFISLMALFTYIVFIITLYVLRNKK